MIDWTHPTVLAEAQAVAGCGCWWTSPDRDTVIDGTALDGIVNQDICGDCLSRLLAWAAAKEREACAELCRDMADGYAWENGDAADGAFECARALRARGGAA